MPLAERLIVAAPAYRDFRIAARIVAVVGARPERVLAEVRDALASRLVPGMPGKPWPLGRDVSATAVAGWIRRVAGVAAVSGVTLLDARGRPTGEALELRRDQLPRLITEPADIVVEAGGRQ
jgi:phage-related baseplate assembly protein